MAFTTYSDAIRTYFNSRWGTLGDGSAIVYENVEYKPTIGTAYLAFAIRPVESTWVAPGSSDSVGAVVIAVFAPIDAGPEAGETLAQTAATCLARQSDSGVVYMEATIEPVGPDGNGFTTINVRIPYFYSESH